MNYGDGVVMKRMRLNDNYVRRLRSSIARKRNCALK
uniref:Uncharacterized protein n=1 Tax=Parascaris equorum TaxID=6256 RepID=A0A914RZR0_PAREQ